MKEKVLQSSQPKNAPDKNLHPEGSSKKFREAQAERIKNKHDVNGHHIEPSGLSNDVVDNPLDVVTFLADKALIPVNYESQIPGIEVLRKALEEIQERYERALILDRPEPGIGYVKPYLDRFTPENQEIVLEFIFEYVDKVRHELGFADNGKHTILSSQALRLSAHENADGVRSEN
jgi:hypothetical protein